MREHNVLRKLTEELAWATDKQLQVISNIMLFKTVTYTTKKLKNKAVLGLNNIVCSATYVVLCNVL